MRKHVLIVSIATVAVVTGLFITKKLKRKKDFNNRYSQLKNLPKE